MAGLFLVCETPPPNSDSKVAASSHSQQPWTGLPLSLHPHQHSTSSVFHGNQSRGEMQPQSRFMHLPMLLTQLTVAGIAAWLHARLWYQITLGSLGTGRMEEGFPVGLLSVVVCLEAHPRVSSLSTAATLSTSLFLLPTFVESFLARDIYSSRRASTLQRSSLGIPFFLEL